MSLSPAQLASRDPEAIARLRAMSEGDRFRLRYHWPFWARPEQRAPVTDDEWSVLLWLAGRGFGKTRSLTEWCRDRVYEGARYIGLVARTSADVRSVLVDGPSGLLNIFPPSERPRYEPSKRRITFHTGAMASTYSSEEPDQLRGPEHDTIIADELCTWKYPEAWSNLMLGLRSRASGLLPRVAVATTPKPRSILRELMKDPSTVMIRGSTFDNACNLPDSTIRELRRRYEGTAIGKQELLGEILDEAPGALWRMAWLESARVSTPPDLERIVVAVDPSVTEDGSGAEAGIIVAGKSGDRCYILADRTVRGSPLAWGVAACQAYHYFRADKVIAESNNGGALVSANLRAIDISVPVELVHASRGKRTRAEPVAAKYEQGLIHHVGSFPDLEDQLVAWEPEAGEESPDRLDALVWAVTSLLFGRETPTLIY